ncbi:hypothetical protein MCHLDSM_04624 [Mycolicibacterium chlorophenolicum]|uniref:Uncharacterized protein n=1 Tax=Mycolicibacterium chlorophenolicum TaxID=37916 RepID=A0A0J6VM50_9MYCO|nr:hypothetical protein MCHLDSM_04624 [Mycolicibacterium chlorophenolicum]
MTEIDRRVFLRAGLAATGLGLLAACTARTSGGGLILPGGQQVGAAEAGRRSTGQIRAYQLTAQEGAVDLGGKQVRAWTYGAAAGARDPGARR